MLLVGAHVVVGTLSLGRCVDSRADAARGEAGDYESPPANTEIRQRREEGVPRDSRFRTVFSAQDGALKRE